MAFHHDYYTTGFTNLHMLLISNLDLLLQLSKLLLLPDTFILFQLLQLPSR